MDIDEKIRLFVTLVALVGIPMGAFYWSVGDGNRRVHHQKDLSVKMVTALANEFECETNLPNKNSIETIVVTCKNGKLVTLSEETSGIQVLKK